MQNSELVRKHNVSIEVASLVNAILFFSELGILQGKVH